ncbi:MAG: hypothetical protein KDK12_01965 [Rhodobacteraceae bacterium]|nr:hypothetical protein [Paracoccaceae bacterium]
MPTGNGEDPAVAGDIRDHEAESAGSLERGGQLCHDHPEGAIRQAQHQIQLSLGRGAVKDRFEPARGGGDRVFKGEAISTAHQHRIARRVFERPDSKVRVQKTAATLEELVFSLSSVPSEFAWTPETRKFETRVFS